MRAIILAGLCAVTLSGCTGTPDVTAPQSDGNLRAALRQSPPPPDAGRCWHEETLPAVFETITRQTALPAGAGGARLHSEAQQRELQPRRTLWFEVPCPPRVGAADLYHASLQRALKARGLYDGAVTGVMDGDTGQAVLRYQSARGLHSRVLSLAAAQALGLISR